MAGRLVHLRERLIYGVEVDALTGLLDGPRARQAFLLRLLLMPPWSIHVDDRAALSVIAMLRGEASITLDGSTPTRLVPGDVAIVRGPEPYDFADPPGTPPQVVALPGGACTSAEGGALVDVRVHGVRTLGNDPVGDTEVLIGAYEHVSELGRHLLAALPRLAVVPASVLEIPVTAVLGQEIVRDEPGQQVVLDRLLDLFVVSALRSWFTAAGPAAPGWFRATADPIVGPALRLLQDELARPWTIERLAAEVGTSRATLARRFATLVGEPPMTFLTGRRLALAADLLLEPDTTVEAVAHRVGYTTPFAFSTAFKRVHGHRPSEHRHRSTSPA